MAATADWAFSATVEPTLPALAWVARIRPGVVEVACGNSVRVEPEGIFEGVWAGDDALESVASATTVFGSGVVRRGGDLLLIGPSHSFEGVYFDESGGALVCSNSLVGLLVSTGRELDPRQPYPQIFLRAAAIKWFPQDTARGPLHGAGFDIPVIGGSVAAVYYENLRIGTDLTTEIEAKLRERTFTSFADYRQRLFAMTESVLAQARPREAVVALSSGYDSTATAAVAAQFGARRAISFADARGSVPDSGEPTAEALGMKLEIADRLAYRRSRDLPEAEFLATGMSGEDVIFSAFEEQLRSGLLLTGYWSGHVWQKFTTPYGWWSAPVDVAGNSLTEFRLRTDFIHVPLPHFGAIQDPRMSTMANDADMLQFHVGGGYDRPVPRRLAEEAGVPRGTFAFSKRAANANLHRDGEPAFAPATLESIREFSRREGAEFGVPPRPRFGPLHRRAIRLAHRFHARPLVEPLLARRRSLVHFDPMPGNVLLRWAVSVVRPRYAAVAPSTQSVAGQSVAREES